MEVPYDVWLQISKYIPDYELQELYGVCSGLYDIAMDARYRSVSIYHPRDGRTLRCFHRLVDPNFARRVRDLHLRPGPLGALLLKDPERARKTWKNGMKKIPSSLHSAFRGQSKKRQKHHCNKKPKEGHQHFLREIARTLLHIVSTLSHVTSLYVECRLGDDILGFKYAVKFLLPNWKAFCTNLTSLTLNCPIDVFMGSSFNLSSIHLPKLENLAIKISIADPDFINPADETTRRYLIPFVNNNLAALRSLRVASCENYNLSYILSDLDYIPNLQTLAIVQCYASLNQIDTSGINAFIMKQGEHLRELTLLFDAARTRVSFPEGSDWFHSRFIKLPLPKLETLKIGLWSFPISVVLRTLYHFYHLCDSLTNLELRDSRFTYTEIKQIIDVISPAGTLRKINMHVLDFSPEMLELFANEMPYVTTLKLKFNIFWKPWSRSNGPSKSIPALVDFCRKMSRLNLKDWNIQRLDLEAIEAPDDFNAACLDVIAESVPLVRTINGKSREVFASQDTSDTNFFSRIN